MPEPKKCTDAENESNAKTAATTGQFYGLVELVVTGHLKGDNGEPQIEFVRRGDEDGKRYVIPWGVTKSMWAPCPSSLPSNAVACEPSEPPEVGAYGSLYLSETFLEAADIPEEAKWPLRLAVDHGSYPELAIYPLSLELTGVEMVSGDFCKATIDLLDPTVTKKEQTLELDGTSPIKVALSAKGWDAFLLHLPTNESVEDALRTLAEPAAHDALRVAAAWTVIARAAAFIARGGDLSRLSERAREGLKTFLKLS